MATRAPSPWRSRRFRYFAAGNLLNNIGETMYAFALPLLVLSISGSLTQMAALIAVSPIIFAAASPILGHIVDKWGSKVLVVPGLLLQLGASVALNIVLLNGVPALGVLFLAEILVQFGSNCYRAGWMAGVRAMFPDNAGRSRATLTTLFQISLMAGPALAAVLVGSLGFPGLLWLNSATFLAPLVVWFVGINPAAAQAVHAPTPSYVVESMRAGARELWKMDGIARTTMFMMVPLAFVFSPGTTALFVFAATTNAHSSAAQVGLMLALANGFGVAAGIATSELPKWNIRPLGCLCMSGVAASIAMLGFTSSALAMTALMAIFFACNNSLIVASNLTVFEEIPQHAAGRILGFWRLLVGVPGAVAPIAIAAVGESVHLAAIFGALATIALTTMLGVGVYHRRIGADVSP
ncbi:MFS transporter [Nocardia sp. NPDC058666]|uniref:MFS transporter n=1 Tax=Nocardia sp. NPDC058666 TaxID=3346587 RepID=UPI0036651B1A